RFSRRHGGGGQVAVVGGGGRVRHRQEAVGGRAERRPGRLLLRLRQGPGGRHRQADLAGRPGGVRRGLRHRGAGDAGHPVHEAPAGPAAAAAAARAVLGAGRGAALERIRGRG
ncbi:unnamed protein product, partial [Prorocentrum cordatum]